MQSVGIRCRGLPEFVRDAVLLEQCADFSGMHLSGEDTEAVAGILYFKVFALVSLGQRHQTPLTRSGLHSTPLNARTRHLAAFCLWGRTPSLVSANLMPGRSYLGVS